MAGPEKPSLLRELKDFILRGDVVGLAVAVVIAVAFNAVVQAMVRDIITPIIAIFGAKPNFGGLYFTINKSQFMFGDLINQIITFLTIATAVFFLVVKPMNLLMRQGKHEPKEESSMKVCSECLSSIRADARRCAYCTSPQAITGSAAEVAETDGGRTPLAR